MTRTIRGAAIALLGVTLPAVAQARFHLWNVNEVFSNADGTIQFVEFTTQTGFQDLVHDHSVEFLGAGGVIASAPFGTNLSTTDTAGHSLLIATPAFQDAAGIEPDFVMPANTIPTATVAGARMSGAPSTEFSFTAGTLPLDGSHSLNRTGGSGDATPTNFAGETGTIVPEPTASALGFAVAGALLGVARFRRGESPLR